MRGGPAPLRSPYRTTVHNPPPSLIGKVCLVTGASGGMGRVIATSLARSGATVVLVCRTRDVGETLLRDIIAATGNPRVEVLVADLSVQSDIRHLAADFTARHTQLHVLVNNAGAHFAQRGVSVDGIELHLAVNHLAWFLLTRLLLDPLTAGATSRVVNVASQAMADSRQVKISRTPRPAALDVNDLQSERSFEPMAVYGRAKLAMVMCGYVLARHLVGAGVTVNAVHPGLVATSIVDAVAPRAARPFLGLVRPFLLTPEQGARPALHLATAPQLASVTGKYFVKQREQRSPDISYDTHLQSKLWEISSHLVGLPL